MIKKTGLLIKETESELKKLLAEQKSTVNRKKIMALYLYKTSQDLNIKSLAQKLGKNRSTLYRWFNIYSKQGLEALLVSKSSSGRPTIIPNEVVEVLKARVMDPNGGLTCYRDILNWLVQDYNLEVDYNTVYALINYKLKLKVKQNKINTSP